MSQILSRKSLNIRIIAPVVVSNIVSGALGAAVSKAINDGWMLVVWFPWVSGVEVDTANPESLYHLIIYFVVALVATVLVEILINGMLMKRRGFKNVARATMIANVVSYLLGCFVLYTYSFVFFD
jgi:biotin transporter BioY